MIVPQRSSVLIPPFEPYLACKDSGVERLGHVPAHWAVRRLRNVSELRVSNVDKHTREGEAPVRLCNYVDVYKNARIRSGMAFMVGTATADEIRQFRLRSGDVLITKDSEVWNDIGVPALVQDIADDVVSGYHLALLRPYTGCLAGRFLFRALESCCVAQQLHVQANGVTRFGLSHNAIKSVRLPVPPLYEQAAIGSFLDYVDLRIRRYIRAKQKLTALLGEQKQAVIDEAVTGRIDVRTGRPYPAYKPCGIAGLGDAPEHWDVVRLSRLIRSGPKNGVSPSSDEGGVLASFAISAVRHGSVDVRDTDRKTVSGGDIPVDAYDLRADDILLVRGNGNLRLVGRAGLVERDMPGWIYPDLLMRLRLTDRALPRFVVALLNLPVTRRQVESSARTAVGTFKINSQDVRQLWLALPDVPEQLRILAHVSERTRPLVEFGYQATRSVELMREYRAGLFAAVVTGKLDVREAARTLPALDPLGAEADRDDDLSRHADSAARGDRG